MMVVMEFSTYDDLIQNKASGNDVVAHVVNQLARFDDGDDANLDFLTHKAIGHFCQALGFAADRNWADMKLDQIAPMQPEGVAVVPEDEAKLVLGALKYLMEQGMVKPEADGTPAPHLLNDFLPEGEDFQGRSCLGHLWEFRYALQVELEHGTTRGTNVTNNHPLLTGTVVMAHLAEDTLYYARLWVMETQGELLNAQLDGKPADEMKDTLRHLNLAQKHLQARIAEKLDLAQPAHA